MTQYQETLSVPGQTTEKLLALSYGAFQHLGWLEELAFEERLVGCTKKSWKGPHDHILVDASAEAITVTGKLPSNVKWDLLKKNKRNVSKFVGAFKTVHATATDKQIEEWNGSLSALRDRSVQLIEKEKQELAEAEAVMNTNTGSRMVTYILIGLNTAVFIAMAIAGVHIFSPQVTDLIKWGADYKPLTTGGEWWRLLTSVFVHIGIIHLLFNMYALYQAGYYLEPMLGKKRFITAFLCTGILASVNSLLFHGSQSISAGASGAIFGLYGVFLALLSTKLIPQTIRKVLLQSIGIFIVYNLVYGAGSQGIDNSAHLGGLVSGFIIGYLYYFSFKTHHFRPAIALGVVVTLTALLSFSFLQSNAQDDALYSKRVDAVLKIQEKAMAPYQSFTSDADLLSKLAQVSQVEWAKAKAIMDETSAYRLDESMAQHRKLLKEYIDLRIQYNDLSIIALQGKEKVDSELTVLAKQISEKVSQMENKGK